MPRNELRILLLADSHLGFDLPAQQRVQRRRRGHDFVANYATALAPALRGEVDIVVHGGDVFDRPNVAVSVAHQALAPLVAIAARGVPVFVVPGNHERARIPHGHMLRHPNVHVFDRARTVAVSVRGVRVALSGFPYERRDVRTRFGSLLAETQWRDTDAHVRLLCVHHCVEGATVGPADFTFTTNPDVIRIRDVPREFAALFSGHIHRHQVLTTDLRGAAVSVPVMYPGSIERTALAEKDETKGYMIVRVRLGAASQVKWEFRELPARPMLVREISCDGWNDSVFEQRLRTLLQTLPPDAVLTMRVHGARAGEILRRMSAARRRALVPATMNVEIRAADGSDRWPGGARTRYARAPAAPAEEMPDLFSSV
jgi:exonuclease SbcD